MADNHSNQNSSIWRWGLRENPFDDIEAPNNPRNVIGEEELKKVLLRIHNEYTKGRKTPRIIAIIGPPGQGKTHILKYWRTMLHDQKTAIVTYLSKPFVNPSTNLFRPTVEAVLTSEHGIPRSQLVQWLTDIYNDPIKSKEFEAQLPYRVQTSDLSLNKAFRILLENNPNLSNAAWKWITGMRLLSDERLLLRESGMSVSQDSNKAGAETPRKAVSLLLSVIKTSIMANGLPFYLLIDEIETLANLGNLVRMKAYLENIRMFRQSAPLLDGPFCLILACTPEIWALIERQDRMLAERVTKLILLEGPQSKSDVDNFIRLRMTAVRESLPEDAQTNELYPFTPDYINNLYNFLEKHTILKSWRIVIDICRTILDAHAVNPKRSIASIFDEVSNNLAKRLATRDRIPKVEEPLVTVKSYRLLKKLQEGIAAIGRALDRIDQRIVSLKPFISTPAEINPSFDEAKENIDDTIRERLFALSPYYYSIRTFEQQAQRIEKIADGYRDKGLLHEAVVHYLQAGRIVDAATKACEGPGFWMKALNMALTSLAVGYIPALLLAPTKNLFDQAFIGYRANGKAFQRNYLDQLRLPALKSQIQIAFSRQLENELLDLEKMITILHAQYESGEITFDSNLILERTSRIQAFQDHVNEITKLTDNIQNNLVSRIFQSPKDIIQSYNQFTQFHTLKQNTIYAILDNLRNTHEAMEPILNILADQPEKMELVSSAIDTAILDLDKPIGQRWSEFKNKTLSEQSNTLPSFELHALIRSVIVAYQDLRTNPNPPELKDQQIWKIMETLYEVGEPLWLDLADKLPPELNILL